MPRTTDLKQSTMYLTKEEKRMIQEVAKYDLLTESNWVRRVCVREARKAYKAMKEEQS